MTDKEKLEGINNFMQKLPEINKILSNVVTDYEELQSQNKRYRDSIEKAISYFNYDEHQLGMAELQEALEEY